ncbi:MAG: hypothetical protein ACRD26_12955 [Vicinamibacterales bacterium]
MRSALDESGVALVAALMALLLLVILGTALALLAAAETRISISHRAGAEALHAADAAVELVLSEVGAISDWSGLFAGAVTSRFADGVPAGMRDTPAGAIDLTQAAHNPGWRLHAYGALRDLVRLEGVTSNAYVIVWVAPAVDSGPDALAALAHAYTPGGLRREVQVVVRRDGDTLRRLSWHELR